MYPGASHWGLFHDLILYFKKKKKKKPKPKTKQNKNTINTDKDSTLAQKNGPKDWQVTISHLPS